MLDVEFKSEYQEQDYMILFLSSYKKLNHFNSVSFPTLSYYRNELDFIFSSFNHQESNDIKVFILFQVIIHILIVSC